jgi:hypothetical protein
MTGFRIQGDDVDRLVSDLRMDRDPLGIEDDSLEELLLMLRGRATLEQHVDLREAAILKTSAMLAGRRPVPDVQLASLDDVFCAILSHVGIHPAAVAAFARHLHGVGVEMPDGSLLCEVLEPRDRPATIDFDGLSWDGSDLTVPRLPETIVALLPDVGDEGLPLSRIVSHPALDHLPLLVDWCEEKDDRHALTLSGYDWADRARMDALWASRVR